MPIFDYRCSACDEVTEVMAKFGDTPDKCPHCGVEGCMNKLMSTHTQFYFKDGNGCHDRGTWKHKIPGDC